MSTAALFPMPFATGCDAPPMVAPASRPSPILDVPSCWKLSVNFFVAGIPSPGGSKRASFIPKRGGGFVTRPDGRPIIAVRDMGGDKTKNWRAVVAHEARIAHQGDPLDGTLLMCVEFVMPRPKGHFRSNGDLKASAPHYHTNAPDVLKLTRSTEDAMTGIIYRDDKQIAVEMTTKVYGVRTGAMVSVYRLEGGAQ